MPRNWRMFVLRVGYPDSIVVPTEMPVLPGAAVDEATQMLQYELQLHVSVPVMSPAILSRPSLTSGMAALLLRNPAYNRNAASPREPPVCGVHPSAGGVPSLAPLRSSSSRRYG